MQCIFGISVRPHAVIWIAQWLRCSPPTHIFTTSHPPPTASVHSAWMLSIVNMPKSVRRKSLEHFHVDVFPTLSPWSVHTLLKGYDIETNENLPPANADVRSISSGFKNIRTVNKLFSSGIFTSNEKLVKRTLSGNEQIFHTSTHSQPWFSLSCNVATNKTGESETMRTPDDSRSCESEKKMINNQQVRHINHRHWWSTIFSEINRKIWKNFFEFESQDDVKWFQSNETL